MAFRRLPRPLPPAHRGDRYPTRRQAGQHGACLGRSGRTPPVSIGMGGPRCSTITRRPCLFSAVCAAVAPDRPLCFPQMRAHKPCFRRPLVPQNHPPRAPDKHRHSRNTRTCGSQVGREAISCTPSARVLRVEQPQRRASLGREAILGGCWCTHQPTGLNEGLLSEEKQL